MTQKSKRWRKIMERDGWQCAYCACPLDDTNGTVDHIIPKARGGSHVYGNLIAACKPCNQRKGDSTAEEFGFAIYGMSRHEFIFCKNGAKLTGSQYDHRILERMRTYATLDYQDYLEAINAQVLEEKGTPKVR